MSVWCLRLWRGRQSRHIGTCLYELTACCLWFWKLWGEYGNSWCPAESFLFARCLPPLHWSNSWHLFKWNFEVKEKQRLDGPSWIGNFQVFQWSYARWMSNLKEVLVNTARLPSVLKSWVSSSKPNVNFVNKSCARDTYKPISFWLLVLMAVCLAYSL